MSSSTFVGLLFIKLLIGIELLSDNVVVIQNCNKYYNKRVKKLCEHNTYINEL